MRSWRGLAWDLAFHAERLRDDVDQRREAWEERYRVARACELRRRASWLKVGARVEIEGHGVGVVVDVGPLDQARIGCMYFSPNAFQKVQITYLKLEGVTPTEKEPEGLFHEDVERLVLAMEASSFGTPGILDALRLPRRPLGWSAPAGEA